MTRSILPRGLLESIIKTIRKDMVACFHVYVKVSLFDQLLDLRLFTDSLIFVSHKARTVTDVIHNNDKRAEPLLLRIIDNWFLEPCRPKF